MDAAGNKVASSMVPMQDGGPQTGSAMTSGTEAGGTMAAVPSGQAPEQAVVSGPMVTRFVDADSHIVSWFITLRTLRDQELVTPEEYAVRRQANVGALLPLTAPPPTAGLDRPVPTTEQIVGRIRAINRALQLRAMTVSQHAAERSMILDALMPAAPVVVANPAAPPEGLMEAADAVRRLEHLRDGNFITSDEYAKERAAVERGLQPEPPVRPAMTKPAEPMKMEKEMAAPSGPQPAVHVSSDCAAPTGLLPLAQAGGARLVTAQAGARQAAGRPRLPGHAGQSRRRQGHLLPAQGRPRRQQGRRRRFVPQTQAPPSVLRADHHGERVRVKPARRLSVAAFA